MESTDPLHSLRSILRSDDHLQVHTSGDYEQVRITLDHGVQIAFFVDSLSLLTAPLNVKHIHDLRITKASSKCSLTSDQWTQIRTYFDELGKSTNGDHTSVQSIVQHTQDRLLQMATQAAKAKSKERKSAANATAEEESTNGTRFRGGDLIFNRILHDKTIDRTQVIIGYADRFSGLHEIPFNDFKKVHDDEFGVPMHRLRHFKINGKVVWDRTQKIDILTGNEQTAVESNDIGQSLPLVQGLYHFDASSHQWIVSPHLSLIDDDDKIPSTPDTCLPERCHFLTWNILFDHHHPALIHTSRRYPAILDTLKSQLPDVICLQEVTAKFLRLLLDQSWLRENNYYLIVMQSILTSDQQSTYGQMMLTKGFRPRSFSIRPLVQSEEAKPTTKELIVARFGLNAKTSIDLVNLHLHSNRSRNSDQKRCQSLEGLFKSMDTRNFLLVGDFNFGDYDEKEQNLLQQYQHQIHDLWTSIYDLEQDPGFTFDPSQNTCAHITSDAQIKRRFDRYLIHTLHNLYYSVDRLAMIGTEHIPIDPMNNDSDKRIHLSDHYALQLIINFRTRSISHRSALAILPSTETWPLIEPYREQYDPSFRRWPPHINLLWPFFDLTDSEDDEENILLRLRLLLSQHSSFTAEIEQIDTFQENGITFMKLNASSTTQVTRLHESLKNAFPQCCPRQRNSYHPHMTIAQVGKEEPSTPSLTLKEPFQFPVHYVYVLQRSLDDDTTPFRITYQIPLGSVLEPLPSSDLRLREWFDRNNLYESERQYEQKQNKFNQLSSCIEQMFNSDTLHCYSHAYLPYGSFCLGIRGNDLDTVFVLREQNTTAGDETNFDMTLRRFKTDPSKLSDHIADLLETQIKGTLAEEIAHCRKVQALFPILSILFHDQTRVEIFVQVKRSEQQPSDPLLNVRQTIHGVHDVERLLVYVRCPPVFQQLLTFVRTWAQNVGFYGQTYGYLGGYSWAILCAYICRSFFASIDSLASIEQFSIDAFFSLVRQFFSTYAQFSWPSTALRLHAKCHRFTPTHEPSITRQRGSMRILCPTPPNDNTARYTVHATRDLIHQGFQRVVRLLDTLNTITPEDKLAALQAILDMKLDFPHEGIHSLLQLTLTGKTPTELSEWIGWLKSRLAHFLTDCQEECLLAVQTQSTLEYRSDECEALYHIGFPLDADKLRAHRNFSYCLTKFLDQFHTLKSRTDTMQITHRIVDVQDWKIERMQPKPQRTRK